MKKAESADPIKLLIRKPLGLSKRPNPGYGKSKRVLWRASVEMNGDVLIPLCWSNVITLICCKARKVRITADRTKASLRLMITNLELEVCNGFFAAEEMLLITMLMRRDYILKFKKLKLREGDWKFLFLIFAFSLEFDFANTLSITRNLQAFIAIWNLFLSVFLSLANFQKLTSRDINISREVF